MTEREPDFSRVERKKGRNRSNRILNSMIAVVVLLIVIASATILFGNKEDQEIVGEDSANTEETKDDVTANEGESIEDSNPTTEENKSEPAITTETDDADESATTNGDETSEEESDGAGTVTYNPSDDAIIAETITDSTWKPIGTTQTGEHVSLYDVKSVDWNEKKQALAYATGLSQDSMIFLKIKNGGGPQKSIGIVSSRDSSQKYRVYLEWVDGEGWKPVKMDKLTTLDFDY
jgi:cytoskeletal protein RodZ